MSFDYVYCCLLVFYNIINCEVRCQICNQQTQFEQRVFNSIAFENDVGLTNGYSYGY